MQIRNLLKLRTTFQQHMTSFLPDAKPEEKEEEETGIQLTPQDQEFIKKMQEIIEQQLADESFSIDTLAAEMNMSRSNFYRKLKALSGMPPNDYLKNCRLNKAAQLLKEATELQKYSNVQDSDRLLTLPNVLKPNLEYFPKTISPIKIIAV